MRFFEVIDNIFQTEKTIFEEVGYSPMGIIKSSLDRNSSNLIKAFRNEVNSDKFATKGIIKHFGGISGVIERKENPTQNYIYFVWDISNPEVISCRDNFKNFVISVFSLEEIQSI